MVEDEASWEHLIGPIQEATDADPSEPGHEGAQLWCPPGSGNPHIFASQSWPWPPEGILGVGGGIDARLHP